jgi:hypothetical protein
MLGRHHFGAAGKLDPNRVWTRLGRVAHPDREPRFRRKNRNPFPLPPFGADGVEPLLARLVGRAPNEAISSVCDVKQISLRSRRGQGYWRSLATSFAASAEPSVPKRAVM